MVHIKNFNIPMVQATMPSDEKHPSRVPMWQGVKVSYTVISACLFPLAIGGYWAYGQKVFINLSTLKNHKN